MGDCVDGGCNGVVEVVDASGGGLFQKGLELCEGHLDGVEVWTVGWQEEDDDLSNETTAAMRDALKRARQPNLSFFAFTATPKFKTKALFDEPGPSGDSPFHEYTMRQAIEEGFVMDVLQNYTTYKRFFGLIKKVENDPEKYQTGFDQPLLQTMYVVKRLAGVQAVQTLSRLNRIAPGKSRTFVLDFANEAEDIYEAFKPYYEATPMGENADPHRLSELQHRLLEWAIFTPAEVTAFAEVWYRDKRDYSATDHRVMNAVLDTVVQRFQDHEEEKREEFRGQLKAYRNLYAFLSQIIPYQDSDLERLYAFVRNLLAKLPLPGDGHGFILDDEVGLRFFRLQQMSEGSIDLSKGGADSLKGPTDIGTARAKDEEVALSSLIDRLNERFGTDFTEVDQLFFDQIRASAENDENIAEAARANNFANFAAYLDRMLDELFIARMEGNEETFSRVMTDTEFRSAAHDHLARKIFRRARDGQIEPDKDPAHQLTL